MTRSLGIAVIPILIATPVFGQSLVEAAKKAQEQREPAESASRVWTNADVPRNGRPLTATGTTRPTVPVTRVRPIPQPAADGGDPDLVRAEELPVSLARIRRKLEQAPPSHESLLRFDFYVEVVGKAPAFHIFEGFDLHGGPVPYGAPTHSDMLRHWRWGWTPR